MGGVGYRIFKVGKGLYRVEKVDGSFYLVNLDAETCTCKGFTTFGRCKHIPLVQGYVLAKAEEGLTDLKDIILRELAFTHVKETEDYVICYDELPCSIDRGCIIDIETTGMDHEKDEIITFGMIERNELRVIQRKSKDPTAFYAYLSENVLPRLPLPVYAYNSEFEKRFLSKQLGFEAIFVDLMEPWRVKADEIEFKYPTLDELIPAPEAYIGERRTTAVDVVFLWRKYLREANVRDLTTIIRHNQIDLLQAMAALMFESLVK